MGASADAASGGLEALNLVKDRIKYMRQSITSAKTTKQQMYGLILLDYSMPGMNGLETAGAIREAILEFRREIEKIDSTNKDLLDVLDT